MRSWSSDQTWRVRFWDNLPRVSGAVFLGLTLFTLALEFYAWVRRVELSRLQTLAEETISKAAPAFQRSADCGQLVYFRDQLDDWQRCRPKWASALGTLTEAFPENLTMDRLLLEGPIRLVRKPAENGLPARWRLCRDLTLMIYGSGTNSATFSEVTDFLTTVADAKSDSSLLSRLELQGGLRSSDRPGVNRKQFALAASATLGLEP